MPPGPFNKEIRLASRLRSPLISTSPKFLVEMWLREASSADGRVAVGRETNKYIVRDSVFKHSLTIVRSNLFMTFGLFNISIEVLCLGE